MEILKILVVALDQDFVIGALELLSPLCHCLDHHQELPIVRVLVLFSGGAFSSVEVDGPKNCEFVVVVKNAGDC